MNILALLVKNHKWYLHGVGSWHFLLVSFMAITRTSWGLMRKNSAATGRYCKRDCSHHSPFSWYSSRFPQSPFFFFLLYWYYLSRWSLKIISPWYILVQPGAAGSLSPIWFFHIYAYINEFWSPINAYTNELWSPICAHINAFIDLDP